MKEYSGKNHSNGRYKDEINHKKRKAGRSNSQSSDNSSIDDEVGHFYASDGDLIHGKRYEVKSVLGKGTFGKVFQCKDLKYNNTKYQDIVAIKVVRSIERYVDSAKIEANILDDIYQKQKANKTTFCVKMYSHWRLDGHYCLVFERLGVSLYDLVKKNQYMRMSLLTLQWVSQQMLEALDFLKTSVNLIHTDLKMENVMFVHGGLTKEMVTKGSKQYEVFVPVNKNIKLIDFGGATYDDDSKKSSIINTRQYRSPEVTLELGWSFPSDIWSAGCIIAEMYSGDLLFQTHDELEHLALIEKCLGSFPRNMVSKAVDSGTYFCSDDSTVKLSHLRDGESKRFVRKMRPLSEHFSGSPIDSSSGLPCLLRGLLTIDPDQRLTAQEALKTRFFTTPLTKEVAECDESGHDRYASASKRPRCSEASDRVEEMQS